MEGTKYHITVVFLFLFAFTIKGTNKHDIYNAYITNNMSGWKRIVDQLEAVPEKSSELLLELVNYQYGYIGWCIGNSQKDEAQDCLRKAETNLKLLEIRKILPARVYGYKSAFYGFHIGMNLFSAPFIGPKSVAAAQQAISLDPDDFFGHVQMGNVLFYSPSIFGGSKSDALKSYLKAKELMEKNGSEIVGDWNYLSLLTTVAKAYEIMNDNEKAKLIYEEILRYEPQYRWVKDELYPQLLKKLKL